MNINCINNKIISVKGVLQPIVLQAIKDIYLQGNNQMTASMVKDHCMNTAPNTSWSGRVPAICNAMRNSIQCGGRIIGDDRDFLDFTIAFDGNSNNGENGNYVEITSPISTPPKALTKTKIQNFLVEKQIDELLENLDWKKLKDKNIPKLLIIGCCDAKSQQPIGLANGERVNYNFGAAINICRVNRNIFYTGLPAKYFDGKKRGGVEVNNLYFMEALNNNNNSRQALDVYGSNRSPFYNPAMKALYRLKIQNCNLHLLIISGLYGVIRHDDYINDYHLEIKKGPNVWGNTISNAVSEYIRVNNIENDAIFYSLSGNYLLFFNPHPNWKNLWKVDGRRKSSSTSAVIISKFLNLL
jgi:hypothetical protein